MSNANSKITPYLDKAKYHAPEEHETDLEHTAPKYKKIVGELRYLVDCNRPDTTFMVGRLGSAASKPTIRHWNIMRAIMWYLV